MEKIPRVTPRIGEWLADWPWFPAQYPRSSTNAILWVGSHKYKNLYLGESEWSADRGDLETLHDTKDIEDEMNHIAGKWADKLWR